MGEEEKMMQKKMASLMMMVKSLVDQKSMLMMNRLAVEIAPLSLTLVPNRRNMIQKAWKIQKADRPSVLLH